MSKSIVLAMTSLPQRSKTTLTVGTLLVLLLSALVLEGIPVVHSHAAQDPALYNAECPLASLIAHASAAPTVSPVHAGIPLPTSQAPNLFIDIAPLSPLLSSADPRAPPTC